MASKRQDWRQNFLRKVMVRGPDECWLWTGATNQDGYGRFSIHGPRKQAHHVAFFLKHGHWPSYIAHNCDTPACCNPAHLREASHRENVAECWSKGRGRVGRYYEQVPKVRELIASGARNAEIVRALQVPNDFVSRLRHGVLYRRPRAAAHG